MSNNNLFVFPERKVLSEVDWNDQSVQEVEQYGKAATPGAKYRASKVLAEQGRSFIIIYHHRVARELCVLLRFLPSRLGVLPPK